MSSRKERLTVVVDENTSGSQELVAAVPGAYIRVLQYQLSAAGTLTVTFKSATTALTGAMSMIAGVPHPAERVGDGVIFATALGEALNLDLSASVQVGGFLVVEIIGQVSSSS